MLAGQDVNAGPHRCKPCHAASGSCTAPPPYTPHRYGCHVLWITVTDTVAWLLLLLLLQGPGLNAP